MTTMGSRCIRGDLIHALALDRFMLLKQHPHLLRGVRRRWKQVE